MSKSQRDKGARIERECVNRHRELGLKAERVPMSGASAYTHDADVDLYLFGEDQGARVCECKSGKQVPKKPFDWLDENDLLYLRPDNKAPAVLVSWHLWVEILGKLERLKARAA